MDLRTIQEKLNEEFRSSDRKLVFWYDDNAEFAEEIDSLKIENAKIYKLTGDNALYTKYFLECEDRENSYLIYAPFPKPADKENHLADMVYYSKQFYADRVSLLCADLHIPEKYKDQLSQYTKFWRSNDRIERFAALGILTDMAYVQLEGKGVAGLEMAFPARYTHSPAEVCDVNDIIELGKLVSEMVKTIDKDFDLNRF